MDTRTIIPEVINNFNGYVKGNRMIGVTNEISLADYTTMTETISGAGILGEYKTSLIGHFPSIEQEISFRMLEEDIFSIANPMEIQELTFRGTVQGSEQKTGKIVTKGIRIVIRGRQISFKPGTLKMGGQMGASVTLEVFSILIEVGGENKFELDKQREVYKVNGVDIMAQIKQYC